MFARTAGLFYGSDYRIGFLFALGKIYHHWISKLSRETRYRRANSATAARND
jgi:hypothetical protein